MQYTKKCGKCGCTIIWMRRWVHALDGDHPLSSVCDMPSPEGEESE